MRVFTLDFSDVETIEDLQELFRTGMMFPSYYGKNPNAFWDCLTDIAGEAKVTLINFEHLPEEIKEEANQYVEMLYEFQMETGGRFVIQGKVN